MWNDVGELKSNNLHKALITINHSVSLLHERLQLQTELDINKFQHVLDSKLIAQLDPEYPLMVAITGGGSTGKSSLFNALVGNETSAVKARAGHSRRVLAAMHPAVLANDSFIESLFAAFCAVPEALKSIDELTSVGSPKYVTCEEISANLVLLDTPDFDTGDREEYTNRSLAKPVLESCDVLVYIFTNATYNNRDNTLFIQDVLTGVGNRKVVLVYRCSRTFTEDEVAEHAEIVARNLYGENYDSSMVVGLYRVNEDDEVASGRTLMRIEPISGYQPIDQALAALDCCQTRAEFIKTALLEVSRNARITYDSAYRARLELELYRNAVCASTSWAATEALTSFPNSAVLKRFLEIWEDSAPRPLKIIKGVGKVITVPGGKLAKGFKRVFRGAGPKKTAEKKVDAEKIFHKNIHDSANDLRTELLAGEISVKITLGNNDGQAMVDLVEKIHECPSCSQGELPVIDELDDETVQVKVFRPASLSSFDVENNHRSWKETLQLICEEALETVNVSESFEQDLKEIAKKYRSEMGRRPRIKEGLAALFPALATVAAVTYVVSTGDFVSGSAISAKIGAMFGLNDMLALVAIPVGTKLNSFQKQQLNGLLGPVYASWFNEKIFKIRDLMQKYISGQVSDEAEAIIKETQKSFDELAGAIKIMPGGCEHE